METPVSNLQLRIVRAAAYLYTVLQPSISASVTLCDLTEKCPWGGNDLGKGHYRYDDD